MQISRMIVTPEMAAGWLEAANTKNRSLSQRSVELYAAEMAAGRWVETHQNAIGFYESGVLADGQHRLAAVVKSGASIPMFVAFGMSEDAVNAIDQGRPRTMSDVLTLSGVLENGRYSSATVAFMNIIRSVETKKIGRASTHEMTVAINALRDGIEFAHGCMVTNRGRLLNAALRGAMAVAYYHCDRDCIRQFASVMASGMPVSDADATAITLRNRILLGSPYNGGEGRADLYRTTLRFIRDHAKGRVITRVHSTKELAFRTGVFDE